MNIKNKELKLSTTLNALVNLIKILPNIAKYWISKLSPNIEFETLILKKQEKLLFFDLKRRTLIKETPRG